MTTVSRPRPSRHINLGLERFSGLYLWALFILVFGLWKSNLFLTQATLHSVASTQAVSGMLALAILVPLAAGQFDLSVGAVINLSTVTVVVLQSKDHWNMGAAIAGAIVASALVGVVNGFVVVKLHVDSFIVTLGMASIVTAVLSIVSGQNTPVPPTASSWSTLTQYKVFGFQIICLYLVIMALIMWWGLDHTPAGRYLYAIGGNREAARLAGVRTGRWIWLSLIISAGVSGIAGVFYGSLSGPSLTFGPALLLPAFAAVFLGSTQLRPGRVNVWGTMLAIYVLATGVQGLEFVTGVQWLNDMFSGVALIVAVAFAVWRQRSAVEGSRQRRRGLSVDGVLPSETGDNEVANESPSTAEVST